MGDDNAMWEPGTIVEDTNDGSIYIIAHPDPIHPGAFMVSALLECGDREYCSIWGKYECFKTIGKIDP